jgi:hypothetical protein
MQPVTLAIVIVIVAGLAILLMLGAYIAGQKGRPATEGMFLALLLGPLGLIIEGLLPTHRKEEAR